MLVLTNAMHVTQCFNEVAKRELQQFGNFYKALELWRILKNPDAIHLHFAIVTLSPVHYFSVFS